MNEQAEYLLGTLAKDPGSKMAFTDIQPGIVRWASEPNRIYTINATTSLVLTTFAPLVTDVVSRPPENTSTDLTTSAESV
jgi:hypothetical protein